ncbi:UNVERIFIED_ORG: uncharacterized protein involved in copper resistance [Burkholderia sp. 1263]
MRMFIAALLGAAALLPALVQADTPHPDPSDAFASVPALSTPSVFADYRAYRDEPAPSWQELNRAVMNSSAMKGMNHGAKPAGGAGARSNERGNDGEHKEHKPPSQHEHSTHEGPAK